MNFYKTSLQTRLTLLTLSTVILFGLVAGYASYENALRETDEIFDAQLAQFGQSLMLMATHTDGDSDNEQTEPMPPSIHKYQQSLAFQVWNTNKFYPRLLHRSNNMTNMTPAQMPVEGYSSGIWQNEHWRFFRHRDEQLGIDVLVGQNDRVRDEIAQKIAWHNILPFLLGLPFLALFTIVAIRFGLTPLRELTESLKRLSPVELHPITIRDIPDEIVPVVHALNNLLNRIDKVMQNERRFTADASHELRTPLAALQAQIQAAQLCGNPTELKECLTKALQGAERMGHLIGQLLTLSRLDELSVPADQEMVCLETLTEQCCAELGADAISKNIEISFTPSTQSTFSGSTDMLHILLRNLLDNAIRYTPQNGHVEVKLSLSALRQVELEIADSGIGVADEKIESLGQRFNRLSPNTADGVGLGLSIVQRIAEIHHAKVTFNRAADLGGLSVKVAFASA